MSSARPEAAVAAAREVVVEAARVGDPDPAEQAQARVAGLGDGAADVLQVLVGRDRREARRHDLATDDRPLELLDHRGGVDRRDGDRLRDEAGDGEERGRAALATAEAGGAQPGRAAVEGRRARRSEQALQVGADVLAPVEAAGDVLADVGDDSRPRGRREHLVEGGDAVGLGRRDGEAPAGVLQGRLADPADAGLDRVEDRQQEVASGARRVAASREPVVGRDVAIAALPAARRRPEDAVDGGSLLGRRARGQGDEVHPGSLATRQGAA